MKQDQGRKYYDEIDVNHTNTKFLLGLTLLFKDPYELKLTNLHRQAHCLAQNPLY